MSEKSKKTSVKDTAKDSTSNAKKKDLETKVDGTSTEVAMADKDTAKNSSVELEEADTNEAKEEPKEKASKVFGEIAAYNWWSKLGWVNIAWTFGVVLLILAFVWTGSDNNRNVANIIFGSIVSGLSLIALILIVTFYFVKKVKCFDSTQEIIALVLSFIPLGFISNFVLSNLEAKRFFSNEKVTSLGYKKPKFVMPHVYIILLLIIFVVIIASWFVTWTGSPITVIKVLMQDEKETTYSVIEITKNIQGVWVGSIVKTEGLDSATLQQVEAQLADLNSKIQYMSVDEIINAVGNIKVGEYSFSVDTTSADQAPAGFLYLLVAPIEGFVNAADLIIFLMIMGGFLAIVTESGALEAGLGRMVKRLNGKEIILIPILFILFSVGGTTYGMAEETIPFYLLLIPVFLAAGFDAYTAFLVILLGAGLGTASSILNPFVVNTATSAVNNAGAWEGNELSPSIGIIWRSVIYVVLLLAGTSYVTWYGWRVKKHPEKSAVYDLRKEHEKHFSFNLDSLPEFTVKRKIILAIFAITFISMIISVITWEDVAGTAAFSDAAAWVDKYFPFIGGTTKDGSSLIGAWGTWYLVQMSFLFFLSSLLIGALSWKGSLHFINKFMAGAADFIGVGIVIAISRGISIAVSSTGLDAIIISGLSGMIQGINNVYLVTIVFFIVFIALSFLIPSTSGFASAVFPLIGPAIGGFGMPAALPGLTISGSIASFSLASGLVNISMPSGGIFMSALSVSKIPLGKFYKSSWWFILTILGLSIALLLIGQAINGNADSANPIF